MNTNVDIKQLIYLYKSGIIRLGIQTNSTPSLSKPKKRKKQRVVRKSKEWEEFEKKFCWVLEKLGGDAGGKKVQMSS